MTDPSTQGHRERAEMAALASQDVGRAPVRAQLARLCASVFRLRSLPLAKWAFRGIEHPLVLRRRFFGRHLYVDVSRTDTHRLLFVDGERFVPERFLLHRLLAPGMAIVEVGANIGYFALLYAHATGGDGTMLCLEPEPHNLVELRRNIERNDLGMAQILPLAAGQIDGTIQLRFGINGVVGTEGDMSVDIRRLDTLIHHRVDFIKVDVEGHEAHVLSGAGGLLAEQRPRVLVEVHPQLMHSPYEVADVFRLLARSHDRITVYLPRLRGSLAHRLRVRYLGGGALAVRGDHERVAAECRSGIIRDPFWVVAEASSVATPPPRQPMAEP